MVYSTTINESTTFAWVMVPARESVPKIKVDLQIIKEVSHITITNLNKRRITVSMPIEKKFEY
jgi:hypothetical protein